MRKPMGMRFPWSGETIHYITEGQGPPLLLLHGLGGNADNWLNQRVFFSRNHRVISPDLPGHGRSTGRNVAFADYWRTIEALLDHLALESVTLCGLSKGARAGLALAARRPERVKSMIVINAFVHLDPEDQARRLALYDLLAETGGAPKWAMQLLELMGVSAQPVIVRGFLKSLQTIDPLHIRRLFRELSEYDQRPELPRIQCQVLLVRGARDKFIPPYCVDDLHDGLSNSRIEIMETCGHLPYLEDPAAFNRMASSFFRR